MRGPELIGPLASSVNEWNSICIGVVSHCVKVEAVFKWAELPRRQARVCLFTHKLLLLLYSSLFLPLHLWSFCFVKLSVVQCLILVSFCLWNFRSVRAVLVKLTYNCKYVIQHTFICMWFAQSEIQLHTTKLLFSLDAFLGTVLFWSRIEWNTRRWVICCLQFPCTSWVTSQSSQNLLLSSL